jgi:ribosomal protein S18 acetylase RimI-like enzyme
MKESINNVRINRVFSKNVDEVQRISIVTFTETYAVFNTSENMKMYIEKYFERKILFQELESEDNFFFIANIDGVTVGYMKLRIPQEHHHGLKDKRSVELERIYVLKNHQRTGLGYRLMQHALHYALEHDYDILWLGVWQKNEKAIRFYQRCGFEIFGEHKFILGTEEQIDWLMKKELKS